jgi:signal peptidase I
MHIALNPMSLNAVVRTMLLGLAIGAVLAFLPAFLGFNVVVVGSGSMDPTLKVGDIAVFGPVDPASVEVGDVVTYQRDGDVISHRVVSTKETDMGRYLRLQGDANSYPDVRPVLETAVVEQLAFSIPMAGSVLSAVGSAKGLGVLFAAVDALLLLKLVSRRRRASIPVLQA